MSYLVTSGSIAIIIHVLAGPSFTCDDPQQSKHLFFVNSLCVFPCLLACNIILELSDYTLTAISGTWPA